MKYNGKFWDVERYAEQAIAERDKLPPLGPQSTEEQKEAWEKKAEAIRMATAVKAAKDIKTGTCAAWNGTAEKLREDYWKFPSDQL